MAPIAIATMMEHVGDMSAISATVNKNFLADPGLHRTLLGDGVTALAGLIGGPANTTYGENTGVLELSHVYDPFSSYRYCNLPCNYHQLYSKGICDYQYDAICHYWWCQLYALRYDFRYRSS